MSQHLLLNICLAAVISWVSIPSIDAASTRSEAVLQIITRFGQLANHLERGEACSPRGQALKQDIVNAFIDSDRQAMFRAVVRVVLNNEALCNSENLLVCDTETKTCACGEPLAPPKDYVIENGICVWNEGTGCANDHESSSSGSGCKSGTSCLTEGRKSDCTTNNLVTEKYQEIRYLDARGITKLIHAGKLCTCQTDDHQNPFQNTFRQFNPKPTRRFRRSVDANIPAEFLSVIPKHLLDL